MKKAHPNATIPWYRKVKFWHLLIYISLLVIIIVAGVLEYHSRYLDILKLYQDYSHATVTAIAHSGVQQAQADEDRQQAYIDQALGFLNTIDQLESDGLLTPERLAELQRERRIFQVIMLNADGTISRSLETRRPERFLQSPWILERVKPLLKGATDTLVTELTAAGRRRGQPDQPPEPRFLVGIHRSAGGAVICHLTREAEQQLAASSGLENLLLEMLAIRNVIYINLELPGYEPLLVSNWIPYKAFENKQSQLLQENLYLVKLAGQLFVEVNDFVGMNFEIGRIQVGFSTAAIDDLRRTIINQILIRSGLFTLAMVVTFFLLITRQNTLLLQAEKLRIEQDVKRLEQLNRIQEKQAAMGTLAAGLAHEIRNPLNAIAIIAQRLKRQFKDSPQGQAVDDMSGTMVKEVKRLNKILEDFLDYSRPTPLKFVEFPLENILRDLRLLFGEQAVEKQVELTIAAVPDLQISGDPEYLKQAFSNIIRNALEAVPENGLVDLSIAGQRHEISITIRDNGPGIKGTDRNRIFDIFYTTKEKGNGIGLAVTHKIISDHNGTIEVDSKEGRGTSFIITLPRSQG